MTCRNRIIVGAVVLLCIAASTLYAQRASTQPATAQPTTNAALPPGEPLWPGKAPGAIGDADADRPTLATYLPPADKATGVAMIIAPGGGYSHLSMTKEGSDVARWLNDNGIAAFVLKYRIAPYHHPIPLGDALRAVRTVRGRAAEYHIDSSKIGMIGFSAGGHLTSTVGTHFDEGDANATDAIDRVSSRPDFLVLMYPVISMQAPTAHKGSVDSLLGKDPDARLLEDLSTQTRVTDRTPPAFIAHAIPDKVVPVENAHLFYDALQKHGVASELIVFDTGGHGFGLAPNDPKLHVWTDRCLAWMKVQKILP